MTSNAIAAAVNTGDQWSALMVAVMDDLRADNERLRSDLNAERDLVNVLENIRNYSMVLVDNCRCVDNADLKMQKYRKFNAIYDDMKAGRQQQMAAEAIRQSVINYGYSPLMGYGRSSVYSAAAAAASTAANTTTEDTINGSGGGGGGVAGGEIITADDRSSHIANDHMYCVATADADNMVAVNDDDNDNDLNSYSVCPLCSQMFRTSLDLNVHMDIAHNRNNQFNSLEIINNNQTSDTGDYRPLTPITLTAAVAAAVQSPNQEEEDDEEAPEEQELNNNDSNTLSTRSGCGGGDESQLINNNIEMMMTDDSATNHSIETTDTTTTTETPDAAAATTVSDDSTITTYLCEKCARSFVTSEALVKHPCHVHRVKVLLGCDWCPYKTFTGKALKRHKTQCLSKPMPKPTKEPLKRRSAAVANQSLITTKRLTTKTVDNQNNYLSNLQLKPKKVRKSTNDLVVSSQSPNRRRLRDNRDAINTTPTSPERRSSPRRRHSSSTTKTSSSSLSSLPIVANLRANNRENLENTVTGGSNNPVVANGVVVVSDRRHHHNHHHLNHHKNNLKSLSSSKMSRHLAGSGVRYSNQKSLNKKTTTSSSSTVATTVANIQRTSTKTVPHNNNNNNSVSTIAADDDDHRCHVCRCLFPTEMKLLNHLSYKHHILSFECQICDYKTNKKFYLERHMSIHTTDKPYQCDECDKWFKTRSILLTHKRQTHSPQKRFSCDLCDYKTSNKNSLTNHRSRHSTSKPFICEIDGCGKGFKTSICLYQHKSVVHSDATYVCEYDGCNRLYNCRKALLQHQSIHNVDVPYLCGIQGCIKTFKEKRSLKRHQNTIHARDGDDDDYDNDDED